MTIEQVEEKVRPNIRKLAPYRCAREAISEGILLDANENPFRKRVAGVEVNRYPDPKQRELRRELASFLEASPGQVLAGTGSDEVLDWIFKIFVGPQDRVAISEPTYGMYRVMASIFGVSIFESPLNQDFDFDCAAFLEGVTADVKVLFLCSPNNPTGNLLDREAIHEVLRNWAGMVVLDEAYIEFARADSWVGELSEYPNLLILRTFSKALGRAGLRLGYLVAHPRVIDYCEKVKAPYNLNALVQEMGLAALENRGLYRSEVDRILEQRERLAKALQRLPGVERVFPSDANFILFRCRDASRVCGALMDEGIVIRDRSSLRGLENCLRVSVGTEEENSAFLQAMKRNLEGGRRESKVG